MTKQKIKKISENIIEINGERYIKEDSKGWLDIPELGISVEIEVHDKNKSFDDLNIKDREKELLTIEECIFLANHEKYSKTLKMDGGSSGDDFFMLFANCKCDKVVIENPVGIMSTKWRKPDQIIQPWQFGDEAQKTTCLWLKGLPKLRPTKVVDKGKFYVSPSGKKLPDWYNKTSVKGNRGMSRGKTFPGIAKAMAEQWGGKKE